LTDTEIDTIHNVIGQFETMNFIIDDNPSVNIHQLRTRVEAANSKSPVGMVVIDYLQLMSPSEKKGRNREQEVSEISRNLKIMAKEMNIPVLALAQLSRQVEERNDKRPQLSDLRESGSLEQDANIVAFLVNFDKYEIEVNYSGEQLTKGQGECALIIAKNRGGRTGKTAIYFDGAIQKFNESFIDRGASIDRPIAVNVSKPLPNNSSFDSQLPKADRNEAPY
jgi:replicative DNA helicase